MSLVCPARVRDNWLTTSWLRAARPSTALQATLGSVIAELAESDVDFEVSER